MSAYGVLLIFLALSLGVVGATLGLNALLGPRTVPGAMKMEPFECGATPVRQRNVAPLPIRYFALAIFFLLFDLETVLLFIWAGAFAHREFARIGMLSFLFFMGMLTLVFAWLWKEGALKWR